MSEKKCFMICGASDEICALMKKSGLTAELPVEPSTDRTRCLYEALAEICDVTPLPSDIDPNLNNAVKLRSTVWTPPMTLPVVSDSDEVPTTVSLGRGMDVVFRWVTRSNLPSRWPSKSMQHSDKSQNLKKDLSQHICCW